MGTPPLRGASAAMETDDEAGLRMRRRAFLNETARLRRRQSGVTPRHDTILEGVYELEPTPDFRTEARLAHQLNLDPVAVKTWFRNRRVRDKRANHRAMGTAIMLIVFVVLACVYLFELDGTPRPRRVVRARRATRPFLRRRDPPTSARPELTHTRSNPTTRRHGAAHGDAPRDGSREPTVPHQVRPSPPVQDQGPLRAKVQTPEGTQNIIVIHGDGHGEGDGEGDGDGDGAEGDVGDGIFGIIDGDIGDARSSLLLVRGPGGGRRSESDGGEGDAVDVDVVAEEKRVTRVARWVGARRVVVEMRAKTRAERVGGVGAETRGRGDARGEVVSGGGNGRVRENALLAR